MLAAGNGSPILGAEEIHFRQDLYYRLAVLPISLPPLRDRRDDIPLLSAYFVGRFSAEMRKRVRDILPEAMQRLTSYHWPGNIRELRNIIERAVMLTGSDTIAPGALQLPEDRPGLAETASADLPFREAQARFEDRYFRDLLARAGNHKQRAAAMAGLDRSSLHDHLKNLA